MKYILSMIALTLIVSCSSPNDPDPVVKLDSSYFPLDDGDTWYFTSAAKGSVVRTIDGDTVISGVTCKRVLENGLTAEAWTVIESGDSSGFYVHLLTFAINNGVDTISPRFVPPLEIPLEMEEEEAFAYDSDGFLELDGLPYMITIAGTLRFKGFINKTVPAGSFADVARVHYETDGYNEYYAPDVGLLDNEDYVLDSAFIDGQWAR